MKSPVINSSLPNSVDGQIQSLYQRQGLNYISNNINIIPRDGAGNIVLQETDVNNPLLIIDSVTEQFTNASVLKVLDTQFKYFKFPARTTIVDEEAVDLNLDLDLQVELQDAAFARYRPSEDRLILASADYSGILMDEVQEGLPQQSTNTYTITKELKNSGVDLRFRIKLQHRYDAPTGFGTAFFSLIKTGEQGLNRQYRTFENTSQYVPNTPGSINQYEVQDLNVNIIIPNSEFEIGDRFGIGAKAGQNNNTQFHTINALQSYWVISDAGKNVDLWNQEIVIDLSRLQQMRGSNPRARISNQEIDANAV
jgi:hypothetical protein